MLINIYISQHIIEDVCVLWVGEGERVAWLGGAGGAVLGNNWKWIHVGVKIQSKSISENSHTHTWMIMCMCVWVLKKKNQFRIVNP